MLIFQNDCNECCWNFYHYTSKNGSYTYVDTISMQELTTCDIYKYIPLPLFFPPCIFVGQKKEELSRIDISKKNCKWLWSCSSSMSAWWQRKKWPLYDTTIVASSRHERTWQSRVKRHQYMTILELLFINTIIRQMKNISKCVKFYRDPR